ncbi:MAG: 30S ribosomal protein S12 methylthiotransferase RimO [Bacteroidales bacterium]|nr:30S ribosomal protein S12 methylthiotransferase RimO [Bacteroidales bacterium]
MIMTSCMFVWYESNSTLTLETKKRIDILTLGCSKNLVDSERLMARLENAGYKCYHDADRPTGRIVIINTCGFIGDAKEESINTILQFAQRKTAGKVDKLYVMGCLSQRYLHDLEDEIPEVDKWFGKFDFMKIVEEVERQKAEGKKQKAEGFERKLTTPKHYAYLKISEGCNRFCSYCAIPLITGRHTSRAKEDILSEARWLVGQGVKEINVIAQDLSSYGLDLYGHHALAELVDELAQIDGIYWIRLHYAYPTDFPDELLEIMAKHKNVCKYLDIALQHCTTHMLTQMRRHITSEEQDALIAHIREKVPGIHIRTTLMVGHPGETEEDFEQLCQWTRKMRFERMGAFAYSEEEGTYAAQHYTDDVPDEIKQKRLSRLMDIQQAISAELQEEKVGKVLTVLVDREETDYWVGRTEYDSPEVDCEVLIQKENHNIIKTGDFIEVKIERAEEFDLYGKQVNMGRA